MSRPDRDTPVWLLDIDGVINCSRPNWHQKPSTARAYAGDVGYQMRWAPSLVAEIAAVKRDGLAEIRWASTWCGYTQQFARLWGLDLRDAFQIPTPGVSVQDIKIQAALDVVKVEKRPLIWTDDDAIPSHGPTYVELRDNEQALLIWPSARFGLEVEAVAEIRQFCETLRKER